MCGALCDLLACKRTPRNSPNLHKKSPKHTKTPTHGGGSEGGGTHQSRILHTSCIMHRAHTTLYPQWGLFEFIETHTQADHKP